MRSTSHPSPSSPIPKARFVLFSVVSSPPLPLSPVRPPFTANLTISSPEPLSRLTENSFVSPHLIHPVSQHQTCHLYQFSLPLQPIRQVKLLATRPYCLRQLWREIHPLSLHSYFADLILCSAISFSSDAPRAGP